MNASDNLLERSSLYREALAEREEILKHKWCESEKAGRTLVETMPSSVGWCITAPSGSGHVAIGPGLTSSN